MTWGAVAIGGASLVSGYLSSREARKLGKQAQQSEDAVLAFEQEKYDDWQATYGGIEDNLAQYYGSITPDYYEAQGLQAFEQERERELENVRSTLAQRGIQSSGIAGAIELEMAQSAAENRAQIRAQAPSLAAEEQRSFLQVGLGQNPGESYSRSLAEQSARDANRSFAADEAAGDALSSAITTIGTGLSDYFNKE